MRDRSEDSDDKRYTKTIKKINFGLSLSPRSVITGNLTLKKDKETSAKKQDDELIINSHYFLAPSEQIQFNILQIEKQL